MQIYLANLRVSTVSSLKKLKIEDKIIYYLLVKKEKKCVM